jgi:hypothetical protein
LGEDSHGIVARVDVRRSRFLLTATG